MAINLYSRRPMRSCYGPAVLKTVLSFFCLFLISCSLSKPVSERPVPSPAVNETQKNPSVESKKLPRRTVRKSKSKRESGAAISQEGGKQGRVHEPSTSHRVPNDSPNQDFSRSVEKEHPPVSPKPAESLNMEDPNLSDEELRERMLDNLLGEETGRQDGVPKDSER